MTVIQIADRLRSESDAYLFLEELRWGTGEPVCPHCGNVGATYIVPTNGVSRKTRTGAMSERRVWRCRDCRKQFSVLTGTIFHGTKVSIRTWVLVFFDMCLRQERHFRREVERKYGVCPRTAWHMMHRIREAMKSDALVESMRGIIVADETWIGGDPKNWHASVRNTPVPVKPGTNLKTDKTSVLSLINETTGEVRSRIVPDVSGPTLRKVISEQVNMADSWLWTDGWMSYRQFSKDFLGHEWVDHEAGEYVRGRITTNRVEGYFSQLKRSLDGTHHHVSKEHLHRYLAEFDYRYSTRKLTDTARMASLMQRVAGKRLTYRRMAG